VWERLAERLEGRLAVVEPLAYKHEEGLWDAATSDPEVWCWLQLDAAAGRSAFRSWPESALERAAAGSEAPFAVLDRAGERPLGSTRFLTLRPEHRGLEIGWTWLARPAWGTGVNVETKLLLLAHAFETLGCMRVEFKTDARNARSRGALEALPARFEGVFRKHMVVQNGDVRDSAYYAITDEDWPSVRKNLERRLRAKEHK
jgi:RimJ/RimL family protein N-acetyltransferase